MSSASSPAFARKVGRQLNAVRRHALSLLAYSWHWQRPHLISWAGSVIVVGSLMALAASVQLTVTLVGGAVEREMQSASQIQVFLADEAKPEDVSALTAQLKAMQGVKGVQYRSKAEAAKLASQDSQLAPLSNGTQSNPYPATLVVDVQDPAAGGRVAEAAQKSAAADRQVPVSYTPEDARKLSRIFDVLRFGALALDLGVALVATMAALRLFRSEARARRQELRILALVGVRPTVLRAPLLFQALSVALAASALTLLALWWLGTTLPKGLSYALPFLTLSHPLIAARDIGLVTVVGSCVLLGSSALLVRVPK
ncbi:MAG: permease-like cell division protein FtsX [Candidatus Dormibacteraeota bacterium]|nr:permease-like cell division protein FtsX [Candidatus Dormibacteraeota bacterium]